MAAPKNTYDSLVDLSLGQVPNEIEDEVLYTELLDIHNAIERLVTAFTDGTPGIVASHDDLIDVTPDQHHAQAHLLYGPDQSDVDSSVPIEANEVLANNGTVFVSDRRTKMHFQPATPLDSESLTGDIWVTT